MFCTLTSFKQPTSQGKPQPWAGGPGQEGAETKEAWSSRKGSFQYWEEVHRETDSTSPGGNINCTENKETTESLLINFEWRYIRISPFLLLSHRSLVNKDNASSSMAMILILVLIPKAQAAVSTPIRFLQSCKGSWRFTGFSSSSSYSWKPLSRTAKFKQPRRGAPPTPGVQTEL